MKKSIQTMIATTILLMTYCLLCSALEGEYPCHKVQFYKIKIAQASSLALATSHTVGEGQSIPAAPGYIYGDFHDGVPPIDLEYRTKFEDEEWTVKKNTRYTEANGDVFTIFWHGETNITFKFARDKRNQECQMDPIHQSVEYSPAREARATYTLTARTHKLFKLAERVGDEKEFEMTAAQFLYFVWPKRNKDLQTVPQEAGVHINHYDSSKMYSHRLYVSTTQDGETFYWDSSYALPLSGSPPGPIYE